MSSRPSESDVTSRYQPEPQAVLFVHSSNEMYGSDRVLLQLIERLPANEFRPIVVLPTDIPYQGELGRALQAQNVQVILYDTAVLRRNYLKPLPFLRYIWRMVLSIFFLVRMIQRESVCIVHSNTSAVIPGAAAALLTRTPHVWHIHEILVKPHMLGVALSTLVCFLSETVAAISDAVSDQVRAQSLVRPRRMEVIWNGVDTERFSPAVDGRNCRAQLVGDEEVMLGGVVGRLSHWKGQSLLIQAAKLLAHRNEALKFVIAGSPAPGQEALLDQLQHDAAAAGMRERIRFVPYTDETPQLMAALDFLVLPSILPEPFGLVLVEAMASGRSVIAPSEGGPQEIVVHGETGLLFRPRDAADLARCIQLMASQPLMREQFGQRSRVRVEEMFSLEAFARRFVELYRSMLAANQTDRRQKQTRSF